MRKRHKVPSPDHGGRQDCHRRNLLFQPHITRDHQPVFKGRTLSQWLTIETRGRANAEGTTPEQTQEAVEAVRTIGR